MLCNDCGFYVSQILCALKLVVSVNKWSDTSFLSGDPEFCRMNENIIDNLFLPGATTGDCQIHFAPNILYADYTKVMFLKDQNLSPLMIKIITASRQNSKL